MPSRIRSLSAPFPHSRPSDVSAGTSLPKVSHPSTVSFELAPCEQKESPPTRFRSRVFSTPQRFLASSNFAALFRAATVPGFSFSRGFPSQRSRAPLEAASSLVVRHRCARLHPPGLIAFGFLRRRRFRALACLPRKLWNVFQPRRSAASRRPWAPASGINPFHQLRPLRSVPPFASPCQTTQVAPRRRSILS